MDIVGYGRIEPEYQGPPRAPGYKGEKRWIVRLGYRAALMIYAPDRESAIVHAAAHFGYRWQDQDYIMDATASTTKQKG